MLQLPSAVILEPPKLKCLTISIVSPSIFHEVTGPDAMIFVFCMLNFKPTVHCWPYFVNKDGSSQGYGFSSDHVWMWELDYKESWEMKNWFFWTVVLEKTLESPLDCKEIQPVYPKGDQSWLFIGRTDAKAETPILWPPHAKSWIIGKDPDVGKDWRQEEKGTTEDEMSGWHHRLNGLEFG